VSIELVGEFPHANGRRPMIARCLLSSAQGPIGNAATNRGRRPAAPQLLATLSAIALACASSAAAQAQNYQPIPDSPFVTTQPPATVVQPPTATLQGIQPWDPYAEPADIYTPAPVAPADNLVYDPNQALVNQIQLFKQVEFNHTFIANNGGANRLGAHEFEFSTTVQFPLGYQLAPLEITPGFGLHLWDGPSSPNDLPAQTYDAWLDVAWNPVITPWFRSELAVRPGVYSDFHTFNTDKSIRIKGKALLIFRTSPTWEIVAGVIYYDRYNVKIMPAGGVVWTPNPDTRFEIYFPKPKLASRATTWGNTELWWYLGGEYGGDSWTIEREWGASDGFDYEDIRVYLGLEFLPASGVSGRRGFIEFGFAFDRKITYLSGQTVKPEEALMLRTGLTW